MVAPTRAASLLAVVPLLFACEPPTTSPSSPAAPVALVAVTSGIFLNEPGFEARVIADGLDRPQGTVQFGNGVIFVNSSEAREIVRVLPSGKRNTFAAFPAPAAATSSALVDLIFDPGRGLIASILATPVSLAAPVWQIKLNGGATELAAVSGAQTFLALDNAGRVNVVQGIGDVVRVELDGTLTAIVDADPSTTRLRGITFDDQGRLYVLSTGELPVLTRIRRFDLPAAASLPIALADGELITDDLPVPPSSSHPMADLTFWPRDGGDLFTTDAGNVYRVKLDGTVSVFATGLMDSGPPFVVNTLALSGAGGLLVTEYAAGRVTRIRAR